MSDSKSVYCFDNYLNRNNYGELIIADIDDAQVAVTREMCDLLDLPVVDNEPATPGFNTNLIMYVLDKRNPSIDAPLGLVYVYDRIDFDDIGRTITGMRHDIVCSLVGVSEHDRFEVAVWSDGELDSDLTACIPVDLPEDEQDYFDVSDVIRF